MKSLQRQPLTNITEYNGPGELAINGPLHDNGEPSSSTRLMSRSRGRQRYSNPTYRKGAHVPPESILPSSKYTRRDTPPPGRRYRQDVSFLRNEMADDISLGIQFRLLRADARTAFSDGVKLVHKDLDSDSYASTKGESPVTVDSDDTVAELVRKGGDRFMGSIPGKSSMYVRFCDRS